MISCDLSFSKKWGRRNEKIESHALALRRAEATGPVNGIIWKRLSRIPLRIRHQVYPNSLKIKRRRVGTVLAKDNAKDKQIIIVQNPRTHAHRNDISYRHERRPSWQIKKIALAKFSTPLNKVR